VELDDAAGAVVPDTDGYSAADIRRGLAALPFNQRAALVMRELEGRSYAEIAEILGVSVSAVETLIFRGRRALREQLETSLTCHEAERAVSLQLDGRLKRADKGALRAHLRSCSDCARFARSQRAHRAALRGLGAIPLPPSLASLFGGGAGAGGAVAAKVAAVGAASVLVAGGSVTAARELRAEPAARAAVPAQRAPIRAARAPALSVRAPTLAAEWASARQARAIVRQLRPAPSPSRSPRALRGHKSRRSNPSASRGTNAAPRAGAAQRARPKPPVRARGRVAAPGQSKPKLAAPRPAHAAKRAPSRTGTVKPDRITKKLEKRAPAAERTRDKPKNGPVAAAALRPVHPKANPVAARAKAAKAPAELGAVEADHPAPPVSPPARGRA
jgi:predicted transcriptional regulator